MDRAGRATFDDGGATQLRPRTPNPKPIVSGSNSHPALGSTQDDRRGGRAFTSLLQDFYLSLRTFGGGSMTLIGDGPPIRGTGEGCGAVLGTTAVS